MLNGIILNYKNNKKMYVSLPITKTEKRKLKNMLEDGMLSSISCCCSPDILYGISSDLKLYPLKPNQVHASNCALQPESHKIHKKYNSGFYLDESDNQEKVMVNLDFSFLNYQKVINPSHIVVSMKYPHKITGAISVSAFAKHLNMYVFKKMAQNHVYTTSTLDFVKNIYHYASDIIFKEQNATLRDFMSKQNETQFIYGDFEIIETAYPSKYILKLDNGKKIHISKSDLFLQLELFHNTYRGNMNKYYSFLKSDKKAGYHLIFAGFVKKIPYKDAYYLEYLDGVFMLTNEFGLYSESSKEVMMYNHIVNHIRKNKLEDKFVFYKPDFYEPTMYKNDYIGDGIVENLHNGQRYCVEVFGIQNSDAYDKKKEAKIEDLKEKLISWNPAKENLPALSKWMK